MSYGRLSLTTALSSLLVLCASTSVLAKAPAEFVRGEILVKRVDRASPSELEAARRHVRGVAVKSFRALGIELWRLAPGTTVGRAIAELRKPRFGGAVEFAEPNWLYSAHLAPNDPRLPDLWGLLNVGQTGGSADADIDAPEAWGQVTGSPAIVIGVIDSGVDYLHEDLAGNVWRNDAELNGATGVDDDGNGYVDDIRGWDFVNDDNDPWDDFGHGTHTAGTIGAVGDNGVGVAGVNWTVRLMPLKFLNENGFGSTDDAIEAVLYAAGFGVPITNNSWGGGRKSRTLEVAIRDSGALFVASAGNSGSSRKSYPAGYALDNVLSVAATDHDDVLASFSNYGSSWVDLGAPGVSILSTVPDNGYDWADGTSMAAPHVAGVAGLVMDAEPGWTWVEVKDRILATVDPLASLEGTVLTGGRLNAAAAVGAPPEPPADTDPPADVTDLSVDTGASSYNVVALTWTAPGDDGDTGTAALYDIRYSTSPIDAGNFEAASQAQGEPAPQPAGSNETFSVTGLLYDTTYWFALQTLDESGNVSAISNVVQATTGAAPPPETDCANGLDDDLDGATDCDDFDCILAGVCDPHGNNVCEVGESCLTSPDDCTITVARALCGDGICQAWDGEDCESCPEDCNGKLTGKPDDRFCCGGGPNAVDCADARCSGGGWHCESDAPLGACCGDGSWDPDFETEWTCGIEACPAGSAGADPALFVISYFYDGFGPYDDLTTLGAGSTYVIHNEPGGWYGYPDIAECQVDCDNRMRAYNHDSVSAEGPGEYGALVSLDTCLADPGRSEANCCSIAVDQGLPGSEFTARCCFVD